MTDTAAARVIHEEHAALAAALTSIRAVVDAGPGNDPAKFFDNLSAMLFYIDEFPERRHHPTESNLLFPMLLKAAPELRGVLQRLEMDHAAGEGRVRALQHDLLGWRFVGESRRERFVRSFGEYLSFYLRHMQTEETELLPLIATRLSPAQQAELDAAFEARRDPLAGGACEPAYASLLQRITALGAAGG